MRSTRACAWRECLNASQCLPPQPAAILGGYNGLNEGAQAAGAAMK
jgi:hypothetical protein